MAPFNLMSRTPPQDHITGQFRPIIPDNHAGLSRELNTSCQFTRGTAPRDRSIRDCREAFTGDVVDNIEQPEAFAAYELAMDEIQ